MEPFQGCLLLSKFDVSSFSMTGDIQVSKLVILLTLSSSKLIFILLTLGKSKLILFGSFYKFGQVTVILLSLGKTCHEKQFKPFLFDKFSNHAHLAWLNLAQVIFHDPTAGIKNWFLQSINRVQRLSLLLLSVTCFSDFSNKIKYA